MRFARVGHPLGFELGPPPHGRRDGSSKVWRGWLRISTERLAEINDWKRMVKGSYSKAMGFTGKLRHHLLWETELSKERNSRESPPLCRTGWAAISGGRRLREGVERELHTYSNHEIKRISKHVCINNEIKNTWHLLVLERTAGRVSGSLSPPAESRNWWPELGKELDCEKTQLLWGRVEKGKCNCG